MYDLFILKSNEKERRKKGGRDGFSTIYRRQKEMDLISGNRKETHRGDTQIPELPPGIG